jgi:hypothetical protein
MLPYVGIVEYWREVGWPDDSTNAAVSKNKLR